MGNDSFYGKGDIVDTSKSFTVVTKFITADGTDSGALSAIERVYVQNGKVIQNSKTDIKGITTTNKITDAYCKQQKSVFGDTDSFESRGGLKASKYNTCLRCIKMAQPKTHMNYMLTLS